ncbi:MAG: HAMP domain-containing protein, partial [Acidobacteria bacterium]|nr:HAMP domain-containing protein [Acidobacteriota bacterium]
SQPIHELLEGAMAVGRGNFDYRVQVSQRGTELTTLAREFNRMADRLAEQRTNLKREVDDRISLERQLRHTERLAAIGHLAAGVAHEMGAPLQVIDGRARQLQQQPEAQLETRQRNLTIIRSQAARITRIVRQLLNLARPFALNTQCFVVEDLLRDTVELLQSSAEKSQVQIRTPATEGKDESLHQITADPELVHQVILNVCQNGIQAMPDGGTLTLECATHHSEQNKMDYIAIRVTDSGTGIDPEILPRIFDPFFTTKEVGSGTGLGLAVSRRIVEEHLGWMEAENHPDGGAVFTIYLPMASRAETSPTSGPDDPSNPELALTSAAGATARGGLR